MTFVQASPTQNCLIEDLQWMRSRCTELDTISVRFKVSAIIFVVPRTVYMAILLSLLSLDIFLLIVICIDLLCIDLLCIDLLCISLLCINLLSIDLLCIYQLCIDQLCIDRNRRI